MKESEPGEESLQLLVSGGREAGTSVKGGPPVHQASRTRPGR